MNNLSIAVGECWEELSNAQRRAILRLMNLGWKVMMPLNVEQSGFHPLELRWKDQIWMRNKGLFCDGGWRGHRDGGPEYIQLLMEPDERGRCYKGELL